MTFPTAKSLNLACYTCDGTGGKPNGILFHAQRPMTLQTLGSVAAGVMLFTSSTSGHRNIIGANSSGVAYPGIQLQDNAGYYGQTCDGTVWLAAYTMTPAMTGSEGDGVTPGGWTILCHFIPIANDVSSSTVSVGADMDAGGSVVCSGARNALNPANDCCAFFLDLQDVTGTTWQPSVTITDSTSTAAEPRINATDSSGETPRFFTIWAGVSNSQQSSYGTVSSLPVPYTGFTASTTLGTSSSDSVDLNGPGGIMQPLNFLSNPPLFRAGTLSSQSIANNSAVAVTMPSHADVDSYSGWAASTYTVQQPGLYLCHGVVPFSADSTGSRRVGLKINGGTTYWGPGYNAASAGETIATKTQIFSLQAGDTVQLMTEQNSGGSLALANGDQSRMFMAWAAQEGSVSSLWTPPDTSFRWAAGTPGGSLPSLFTQHVGNDLSFLMQRPYLMAYQASAQSGFTNNTWNTVTMDTVAGIIHSDLGDNYGGWAPGSSNKYVAQVAGWYLCVAEAFSTFPSLTTSPSIRVALLTTTSGGVTPSASPDRYQEMLPSLSASTWQPGATAVGLYYLAAGESVTVQINGESYTSTTWGTSVGTGVNSHLEIAWISN